jgi:hypothetical protein
MEIYQRILFSACKTLLSVFWKLYNKETINVKVKKSIRIFFVKAGRFKYIFNFGPSAGEQNKPSDDLFSKGSKAWLVYFQRPESISFPCVPPIGPPVG